MLKYIDEFIEKKQINKVIATLIIFSLFYIIDIFFVKHQSVNLILMVIYLVLLHRIWKEKFIIIIILIYLLVPLIEHYIKPL